MKKTVGISMLILFLTGVVNCGGVGAPPVSLPAPVTGRIVIASATTLGADGNLAVIGEAGAVTENSTVMVINQNLAASLWYQRFLDLLVKDAYAQVDDFPFVCYMLGHACTLADENGAFEVIIPGQEGDTIIIVLIDPVSGAEISDRTVKEASGNQFALVGGPVDLAIGNQLFILFDGGTDSVNRLVVAELSPWATYPAIDIGGAGAINLALGSDVIAVADIDKVAGENGVYVANVDAEGTPAEFSEELLANTFGGTDAYLTPTDMSYSDFVIEISGEFFPTEFLMLTDDNQNNSVYFIPQTAAMEDKGFVIITGGLEQHLGTDAFSEGVVSVSPVGGPAQDIPLLAFVSRFQPGGINGSGEVVTYLSLFRRAEFESWLSGLSAYDPVPDDMVALPSGTVAEDVAIVQGDSYVLVTDSGNDVVYKYRLYLGDNIVRFQGNPIINTVEGMVDPEDIEIAYGVSGVGSDYVIFIDMENGSEENPDSVWAVVPDPNDPQGEAFTSKITPVGLGPTALVYDSVNGYLYVSCYSSRSIARLPISDILP